MRLPLPAMIAAALLASALPALAAPGDDIGATVRVVNLVTAAYEKDQRNLSTGDNVRQDDLIEVGPDGIGEIRLRDDTELALGPGARLLLDEFVYKPDISGGAIVLNLAKGAFRFITGLAAKPAYVIRTPTASITVRGTIFDVYVEASGMSWLLLIDGGLEVCNARDDCGLLDEPGKLIRITPDGVVGNPSVWGALDTGALTFATAFPFVVTPPRIDPDPILTADDVVGGGSDDTRGGDDNGGGRHDDDDDSGDDYVDDLPDDVGPGPGRPPLRCWSGWKRVPRSWSKKGWRVEQKRRGDRVITCARRVWLPPGGGLPEKPHCDGGKIVAIMTLPPRWSCVCPKGEKRIRTGKNAFVCKGGHNGDSGGGTGGDPGGGTDNAKKACKLKGGIWTGKTCIVRERPRCPAGYIGRPPNCKKLVLKKCPPGYIGWQPNCKKIFVKKKKPGDGKKNGKKDVKKDVKKAIENFKRQLQKKD